MDQWWKGVMTQRSWLISPKEIPPPAPPAPEEERENAGIKKKKKELQKQDFK